MPHVSKRKLKEKVESELNKSFQTVIARISNMQEMNSFLTSLLSNTEKLMLAKRLAVVVLLDENIPESTIANILNVTRETVARQRYRLELKGEGYKIAIKKLAEEKTLQGLKKLLVSLAKYSISAAGGYVKPTILD